MFVPMTNSKWTAADVPDQTGRPIAINQGGQVVSKVLR